RHKAKITNIFDKGKGAIVITEITSFDDATGEPLMRNEVSTFVRGAGGWGGDRGPSVEINVPPERAPDATITESIPEGQALLYRLSGDWNPLHADPAFAQAFGFQRPILHGLCTFGIVGRHVLKTFGNDDARLFKSIKVRFAESVFPGESIKTEMWKEGQKIIVRATIVERNKVCISHAAVELHDKVPVAIDKPKPASARLATTQPSLDLNAPPTSGEVFLAIRDHLQRNPDLAKSVANVYVFKLTGPDSAWTVDLKNGAGTVESGAAAKADCTLELANQDFLDMTSGKADAQKLYFGGKMKITGNVMASQKLTFLQKIDPERAKQIVAEARRGGGAAAPATPAGAPASAVSDAGGNSAADVFIGIRDYVERNPELAAKVANIFVFKLSAPDSVWTIDLKNGKGGVEAGAAAKADCTLEMSNQDFLDMTEGKADAQKLYFGGKLKIGGNVMASQKLTFLQKIDREQAKAAVAKAKASGGGLAVQASAATSTAANAPAVVAALTKLLATQPAIAAEIGAKIAFKVGSPDAAWLLDGATITQGSATAPTTVALSDEDLGAWAKGEASAQSLFQHGKLRVDGDVRPLHRLGFFSKLLA
ncbi:MAG: SCP2 sterol-binding domain-containing protein, partial [Polyangiales bacterium]